MIAEGYRRDAGGRQCLAPDRAPAASQRIQGRRAMDVPVIEQIKIQAQVLVPLVKALRQELGEERANAIVRQVLGDLYRKYGKKSRTQAQADLGARMAAGFERYSASSALDYDVVRQAPDAFEVNVTGCRYAKFYKELGEPELGFLLVCSQDFTFAEGLGPDIKLTRTQTIMQGASHCDFRYRRQKD